MIRHNYETDFNQVTSLSDRRPVTIGFSNDNAAEQQQHSHLLVEALKKLESLRSDMSKAEYQQASDQLRKQLLALCAEQGCSTSPAAKRVRTGLSKARGAELER